MSIISSNDIALKICEKLGIKHCNKLTMIFEPKCLPRLIAECHIDDNEHKILSETIKIEFVAKT